MNIMFWQPQKSLIIQWNSSYKLYTINIGPSHYQHIAKL